MHNCFKKNNGYYFSLAVILLLGFFLSVQTSDNKELQFLTIVATGCFYVAWGILHHLLHHNLTAKIVVEYVLIGSLGMTLIFFLLRVGSY